MRTRSWHSEAGTAKLAQRSFTASKHKFLQSKCVGASTCLTLVVLSTKLTVTSRSQGCARLVCQRKRPLSHSTTGTAKLAQRSWHSEQRSWHSEAGTAIIYSFQTQASSIKVCGGIYLSDISGAVDRVDCDIKTTRLREVGVSEEI